MQLFLVCGCSDSLRMALSQQFPGTTAKWKQPPSFSAMRMSCHQLACGESLTKTTSPACERLCCRQAPRKIPPAANTPAASGTLSPLGCTLKCRGQKYRKALQLWCASSAVRTGIDNCRCCHLLLKVTLLVQMQ